MGTGINKEAYEQLIKEDIDRVNEEMKHSLERDHVKAILKWSVNVLYDGVEAIFTDGNSVLPIQRVRQQSELFCPKCKGANIFDSGINYYCENKDCKHAWAK